MTRHIDAMLNELRAAGETIAIHPAAVANRLGLSLHVPMRLIYMTSGPSRRVHLGKQIVELRHDPKLVERHGMTRAPTKKEIRDLAADVIGSLELARDWLAMPAIALGRRKPREMMATAEGRRAVMTLLEQIRFGVYV